MRGCLRALCKHQRDYTGACTNIEQTFCTVDITPGAEEYSISAYFQRSPCIVNRKLLELKDTHGLRQRCNHTLGEPRHIKSMVTDSQSNDDQLFGWNDEDVLLFESLGAVFIVRYTRVVATAWITFGAGVQPELRSVFPDGCCRCWR